MVKQYFTREEAIERMVEIASWEHFEDGVVLMDEVNFEDFFNDYYIIGIAKAREALEEYGVWKAFEEVQDYLVFSGFTNTEGVEFHDAEWVATVLWENIVTEVIAEMRSQYEDVEDFLADNE